MPSDQVKSRHWMLTIKERFPIPPAFWDYVTAIPGIICTKELGEHEDNPHYHILMSYHDEASAQTLNNRVRKICTEHDSKSLGFTRWKLHGHPDDELPQYVCKGPNKNTLPEVRFNLQNWNVQELHDKYWKKSEKIAKDKTPKIPLFEQILAGVEKSPNYWTQMRLCTKMIMKLTKGKIGDHIAWPHIQAAMYQLEIQAGKKPDHTATAELFYERMAAKSSRNWAQLISMDTMSGATNPLE